MLRWVIGFFAGLAIGCSTLDPAFADPPAAGDGFIDCDECPVMVVVPAGRFTMGSPKSEKDREDREGPQRKVKIGQAFALGKFETTRGQYAAFVADSAQAVADKCWTYENEAEERAGRSFRNPGYEQTDDDPVVCVSWDDAQAYVQWLSRKTSATYRLLSEAEWEYAARAGSQTRFSFGDDYGQLCDVGNGSDKTSQGSFKDWTWANTCADGYVYTAPVGSFAANNFGLYDMHGNVWEWVEDCYHDSYRSAPLDEAAWTTGACEQRVFRGGGWVSDPAGLRSAISRGFASGFRNSNVGFRVARTLTP